MAELVKAYGNAALYYILQYKTTMHLGVGNLPEVFTWQRPGWESNLASAILLVRRPTSKPPSHLYQYIL